MTYFIGTNGNYYEGDQASHLDTEVLQRPAANYVWQNGAWSKVEPTVEEKILAFKQAVQDKQDSEAVKKGYDNMISACSYVGFANPFQAEAQAFLIWRAGCWEKCYQITAEVQSGTRPFPTADELLAELPALQLP